MNELMNEKKNARAESAENFGIGLILTLKEPGGAE